MGSEMAKTPSNSQRQTRVKAELAPTTPDPIEIAMEAEAQDGAPDSPARRLLENQNRLIGWQIARERTSVALRLLGVVTGAVAAIALVAYAWQASQADGLVVEPLLTPPQLAARGLTGPVVARQVLDRIAELDRETDYYRSVRVSDGWSQSASIPIPQTNFSLDDVDRALKRWLGRQTYISGEVILAGDRATLVLRTTAGRAIAVEGPAADLRALAAQGAEAVFADARPLQFGWRLIRAGRYAEGQSYYERVLERATRAEDRALAHRGLAAANLMQGHVRAAAAERAASQAASPKVRWDVGNISHMQFRLGHAEAGLAAALAGADATPSRDVSPETQQLMVALNRTHALEARGDTLAALRAGADIFDVHIAGDLSADNRNIKTALLIKLHETSLARRIVPTILFGSTDAYRRARIRASFAPDIAEAEEDWAGLLVGLERQPIGAAMIADEPVYFARRVRALTGLGRLAEANALAAQLPLDCQPCAMVRGGLAEAEGRTRVADHWFWQAIKMAPSLPFADEAWGRLKLARGDIDGALVSARASHRKTTGFADAVELWAEALAVKGDAAGAAAKFAEAAKLAPRWGRLHLKWGEALAKLGKADEARAKWRAAATMDLSAADRAALKAHGV